MARRLTPGGIVLRYAVLATAWIAVSSLLVSGTVADPALRGMVEVGKGLLFVAVTSGFLFLLLRTWFGDSTLPAVPTAETRTGILPLGTGAFALVLLGVTLIVPLTSYLIARHLGPSFEREAHAHLSSIARLQAVQVQQWLAEHMNDARLVADDRLLADWVAATVRDRNGEPAPMHLQDRLRTVQWANRFEGIQVLNLAGTPLLTLGRPEPIGEAELGLATAGEPTVRVHRTDLREGQSGAMVLHLVAVLRQDTSGEPVDIGYVTLTLRPDSAEVPMLGPWPGATSTGRTLLVQSSIPRALEVASVDGEDGTQRVHVSQPFTPGFPLSPGLLAGVPGELAGKERDGLGVLAAHHPIPGSDWQVLASVERSEIMQPLRATIFWVNLVGFVAALLVSGTLLLLWRAQSRSRSVAEQSRASALLDWHIGNSPLAAVEWDQDFRVRKWSPRAEHIFGWSAGEVGGRQPFEWRLVYPDDADSVRASMRNLMDGKQPRNKSVNRNLTKEGEVRYCEWYNSALRDSGGRLESIFSLVQDITDRVRMERALSESEALFRTLIEGAPDGVFVQTDGRFAFINTAGCRLFGAESPKELIGKAVSERFRADCHPVLMQRIPGLNERGEPQGLHEEIWLRLDGTEVPVEVAAQPLRFRERDSALVFARDISVRKEVARQRDFNARLLSMASSCAHVGGWEMDLRTDQVHWSDEVCRMLGIPLGTTVTVAEAMGYFAPEYQERAAELLALAVRKGTLADEEFEIITVSGQRLWVRVVGQPIRDGNGAVVRVEGAVQDVSEQRNAEQRLRESEAKLRAVTETSPDPIIMTDERGRLVYCSPAVETTLGYSPQELVGRKLHDVIAPERYRAAIARGYDVFARSGEGPIVDATRDLEALHRDGHEVPVELSVSSLQIGGRWHAVGVMRDITKRKQFEAHLAFEARRAEALLELPIAAERLDESAFMQRGQELAEELTGSRTAFIHFVHEDQDSIELVTWSRRTLEDDCREPFAQLYPIAEAGIWADALREKRPVVFNDYANRPDRRGLPEGHPELRRLISVPVIENGKATMLAGVGNKDEDYTDLDVETVLLIANQIWSIVHRRRSDVRLRHLSQAIEQSPNSIVITNLAAEIEYVNESFLRTTGYTWSEVMGQNPRTLQSGKTPREHYDAMWAALSRGEPWKGEFYNRRKDGTEYVEFGHVAPLRQANGEITNYVAVKEDITEKKRVGLELDRHRHHLEELVAQRTSDFLDAQLQAESANRAKSAFLANMSHEIRTPMNGVLGMVELLWNTELTEEQADMVVTIRDSGRSLTSLIDDILDFSKIEAGRMELEYAPMSVRHVVEGLCASLGPFASHRQVDLSCFVAPEVPERVLGDEVRLRQMLYNLIGNGIKFSSRSPEHRGRVCARVERSASDPRQLLFRVADNGVGISEENQDRLFQPFAQAEASTTRRFGGTGLGLTICKRLADLMAGNIVVSSALGQGSLFTLMLPFDLAPEQPASPVPDFRGVHCVLIGNEDFCAGVRGMTCGIEDIARQLECAGAKARVFRDAAAAERAAAALDGPAIVVDLVELGGYTPAPASTGFGGLPLIQIRWAVKNVYRRSGVSTLDAATLTRDGLMKAVTVALGRDDLSDSCSQRSRRAPAVSRPTGPDRQDAKILVVEDDAINRKVIQKQLEVLGYRADLVVNGVEAVHRLRQHRYDLVLTDLHMPEMDGYQLIRHIREQETLDTGNAGERRRMPVIVLTANALRGEAEKCQAIGMDAYLTKPLELEVLDAALQRHLHGDAGETSGPDRQDVSEPDASEPALRLFDVSVLKSLVGDDRETVDGLLREYLDTLQRTWVEIESAVHREDGMAIAAAAHKLKSSSRSVGAVPFGELCQQLESAGKSGDMQTIPALLHETSGVLPRLEAAIRSFLDGGET